MPASVLTLHSINKSFGRVKVLDDLSLDIQEGEVFTLLGPSGCGKTTTLRIIAGLESPDSGRITLEGKPIVSVSDRIFIPTHKRNMGMVFQSYAIWPHKTVFENVAYPLRVRRVNNRIVREKVLQVLDLVGLAGFEDRQGPQLSGGQQQRVALARALVHEPTILLLDEPFSNLDAKLREQMRLQVKLLLKRIKVTAIFVTHDQVEALSLSSRIVLMNAGRVEQLGTPRELYEHPATPFARDFLGRTVLFRGTVRAGSGAENLVVQLEDLPNTQLAVQQNGREAPAVGKAVVVAARPEDFRVVPPNDATTNTLDGTIDSLLFVGDRCECRVVLSDDQALFLHTPRAAELREGDHLRLSVAPEHLSVWPL